MPTRDEIAYFGAGPAPLPTTVLEAGAAAFVNYQNTGLSLAEISHRSATATQILSDTKSALTSLLDIPDTHEVLFMHGGGSGEFSAVVFNMVAIWVERRRRRWENWLGQGQEEKVREKVMEDIRSELRCDYIVTGSWSLKASQEAANLLEPLAPAGQSGERFVNIVTDARKERGGKFGEIPHEGQWNLTAGSAFVYYCDNETVDGVEFPSFPKKFFDYSGDEENKPLVVADMSSNFLSRPVDVSNYAVIFGGAQKNIGITDTTLLIVRKDLLTTLQPSRQFLHSVGIWSPPVVFHWPTIAKNNSLYNTMPIFSIWIAGEVMRLLLAKHHTDPTVSALAGQEEEVRLKAKAVYDVLDAHDPGLYHVVPDRAVRSRMNICFRVRDEATEKEFLKGAEERGLQGLKGHRSVGGIRISNYNAVSLEKVERLVAYLQDFAASHP